MPPLRRRISGCEVMPNITLTEGDILELPDDYAEDCDMTYTDPPWENRMVKWFETDMRKAGYAAPSNDIDEVIDRLFELAPNGKPFFCEYGKKGFERVIRIGQARGFEFVRTVFGTQLSKQPFVILQFNSDLPRPEQTIHGFDLLKKAIQWHSPSAVFEPFAGLGITSKIMIDMGCNVVANELSPKRAAKLKERLSRFL